MKVSLNKRAEFYNYIEAQMNPNSYSTESVQKMIVNLEYANVDAKYKVIQITSTLASEGKTTLFGNMAYLLSQRNHKVLLMELDLRRPKINRIFGVSRENGITDYLSGNAKKEDIIQSTDYGLDFIVAGEATDVVSNILESKKLKDLIEELKGEYDYILIDTPPVMVNADALITSKLVDGIIFVIGYNKVKKNYIRHAIQELRRNDIDILGVAFTQVKMPKRHSYYYYQND